MAEDFDRKKMADRIAALLRLASEDSNNSEAEASSAAAKAQELMLKYQIDIADLAESSKNDSIFIAGMTVMTGDFGKKNPNWMANVVWSLARSVGGKAIWSEGRGSKTNGTYHPSKMSIFAQQDILPSLVETIKFLEYKIIQLSHDATNRRHEVWNPEYEEWIHGKAFRASWLLGASERICERLRIARRDFDNNTPGDGTALILSTRQVDILVKKEFPRTSTVRNTATASTTSAYNAGRAAGSNIDLGGTKIGGGSRKQLN